MSFTQPTVWPSETSTLTVGSVWLLNPCIRYSAIAGILPLYTNSDSLGTPCCGPILSRRSGKELIFNLAKEGVLEVPQIELLLTMEQLLQHEVDAKVRQDASTRAKLIQWNNQQDHTGHRSKAFATARGLKKPCLHTVAEQLQEQGLITHTHTEDNNTIVELAVWQGHRFDIAFPVQLDQLSCTLIDTNEHYITVRIPAGTPQPDGERTVTQLKHYTQIGDVFQQLNQYWIPFWQREPAQDAMTETDIADFDQLVAALPNDIPDLQIDTQNVDLWMYIIKTTKSHSAPGTDGIHASDLQMLPKAAISDLVTGFLKGRGAYEAAYDTQQWLEQLAHQKTSRAGATLDLVKCFNLIRRKFASRALRAIGCPDQIVLKWEETTKGLNRYWEIQGEVSDKITSTTGCAEGDPISVVVMIAIAALWIFQTPHTANGVRISAFADNWSWACTDHARHAPIAKATLEICRQAKLQVDLKKTWIWASDPIAETEIQTAAATLHPDQAAPAKVHTAKDLGLQMQYTGAAKLGNLHTRMEEGKARLQRIKHQQWPLEVKAHVIKASVYPAMFHGAEITPIGQEHLTKIRHLVAESLLNTSSRCMSPAILLMFSQHMLLDPGLHVIIQSMKKARQWLVRASEAERLAFLTTASRHRAIIGTTKGPAGTLKSNILQLGWAITKEGDIQVAKHLTLNILQSTIQDLTYWAQQAWNETAVKIHTKRFTLYSYPEADVPATVQVIKRFPTADQRKLLHEIGQAFQTEHQKAKYDGTCDGTCPLCQEPDSKEHRFLHCPSMQEIRAEHAAAVALLQDECPGWIDWPVLYKHEMHDFIHALRHSLPEAVMPAQACQQLAQMNHASGPYLYSDGSCRYPAATETRFAAYALIADVAPDDQCRQAQAMRFLTTQEHPDTLTPLAHGRLPDKQTIHRAELMIIVLATETLPAFQLYTDSSVAKSAFEKATMASSTQSFIDNPHYDLMCRIFVAKKQGHKVHKIKAHRELQKLTDLLDIYHGLGNQKADGQAAHALNTSMPEILSELEAYHVSVHQDQTHLSQVFNYILALQNARARAQAVTKAYMPTEEVQNDPVSFLGAWTADELWSPPRRQLQNQGLRDCAFGLQVAWACQQWLLTCKWPTTYVGPQNKVVGISWIEVALAIMKHLRAYLPVKRQNTDGDTYVIFITNYAQARAHQVTMVEQSETACGLVKQVLDLIPERLTPAVPYGQVRSMYMLGDKGFRSGFQLRPEFEGQREVALQAQWYLQNGKALPRLFEQDCRQWECDQKNAGMTWDKRMQVTKQRQKLVADVRGA
ncbi:unnamed protein product [Cladocopium goreaui]|uniref:Reverse transcriptase domain-containing protein n=1 Tax=Cladocopium goreaui TaxID=2562237 RepID=A0A9P1DB65_9DINO|nr:unnamed protein product [Cladocopium goreaui]